MYSYNYYHAEIKLLIITQIELDRLDGAYAAFNSIKLYHYDMSFLDFASTNVALNCFPQGYSHEKNPRGSSAARTQDPWITSQTLYH